MTRLDLVARSLNKNQLCPKGGLFKKTNISAINALRDGLNGSAVTELRCVPVLWLCFSPHTPVTCTWPALRFATHSLMPVSSCRSLCACLSLRSVEIGNNLSNDAKRALLAVVARNSTTKEPVLHGHL